MKLPLPQGEGRGEGIRPTEPPSPLPSGEGQGEGSAAPGFPPEAQGETSPETQWFGVVIGLGAWTMFFAALVFTVGYLRMRDPWPEVGLRALPRLLPAINLLLLAGGSALLHRGLERHRRERGARWALLTQVGGTIALGVTFLGLQAGLAGMLWEDGLRLPTGGAQASAFYGLMGVHAVHAVVGLTGLTRLAGTLTRGREVGQRLRLWGLYWHFVTVTGLLFYAAVYLP